MGEEQVWLGSCHCLVAVQNLHKKWLLLSIRWAQGSGTWFPNVICVEDAYGCSPLHHACENDWANEIIQVLIESWLQSVQHVTDCSWQPLNYACQGNLPLTVIQMLVEAYPNALHLPDKFGRLPLHVAGNHGCSMEVIEFLIKCQPESVQCQNIYGDLPLCRGWQSGLPAIHSFIEAWPYVVHQHDDCGY